MKRILDFFFSLFGLLLLSPLLFLIALSIKITSKGPIFYRQERVGKDFKNFHIYKFRTMRTGSDKQGLLTIGAKDKRITAVGYYLRKYKLDELPQLINVVKGDMSLVGPRPEVPKYVALYNEGQKKVLSVKPGITDFASIEYAHENEVLKKYSNPEKGYIEEVMPDKLKLNLKYIQQRSIMTDLKIIFQTVKKIITKE